MKRGVVGKKPMREIYYRQSRIARILGEPAKYSTVMLLLKHGPLSLSEIADRIHRNKSTTCFHLSKLKSLEIIRFEAQADGVCYWIKYPQELWEIIKALNKFIKRTMKSLHDET
jgi:predicted transcriptional regulator